MVDLVHLKVSIPHKVTSAAVEAATAAGRCNGTKYGPMEASKPLFPGHRRVPQLVYTN